MSANSSKAFEDKTKDLANSDIEEQPFGDDSSKTSNEATCYSKEQIITNNNIGTYAVDEDEDDDSVKSMLEMMDFMNDPENRNKNESLKVKARRSLKKWKWKSPPSLLGEMSDDDGDEKSMVSYDCIALSSLRAMKRSGGKVKNYNENDEESVFSKPRSVLGKGCDDDDYDDAKSQSTTSTKNTGHGSDADADADADSPSQKQRNPKRKLRYILPLACFLAIVLLLGILILGYSLYALRQDEDEDLSIFTKEFWKEQVPRTLAFWKQDEGEE